MKGSIAQLVEHWSYEPNVVGSISCEPSPLDPFMYLSIFFQFDIESVRIG